MGASAHAYLEQVDFKVPLREQSIIISDEGYYPKTFSVVVGDKLKIYLTSTAKNQSCFMIKGKDTFLSAGLGKITEGEIRFDKVGVYEYYCPTGKISGSIVVRPKMQEDCPQKQNRETASKINGMSWRPKEE